MFAELCICEGDGARAVELAMGMFHVEPLTAFDECHAVAVMSSASRAMGARERALDLARR